MKKLKVGQWCRVIDGVKKAYDAGHVNTWTSGLSDLIGSLVSIENCELDKRSKRAIYSVKRPNGNLAHTLPIECLESIEQDIPMGWYPLEYKPQDEVRNYKWHVGITDKGTIHLVMFSHDTWHAIDHNNGLHSIKNKLTAWTSFIDWPKEFDLGSDENDAENLTNNAGTTE